MFHVKHFWGKLKAVEITDLVLYSVILSAPLQLRMIWNPQTAYIGYYFSYHLAYFTYLSDLLIVALMLVCLLHRQKISCPLWALIPLALGAISVFHVEHLGLWAYSTLKLAEFTFLFCLIRSRPHTHRIILFLLIATGVFEAMLAVGQFHVEQIRNFTFPGFYVPSNETLGAATIDLNGVKILRSYGTFPHPNILGGFLAVSLAISLFVSRETNNRRKLLMTAVCATFLSWGLIVSFSRSAGLAAAIIFTAYILSLVTRKRLRLAIYSVIYAALFGSLLIGVYSSVLIPRTTISVDNQAAVTYREDFNKMAITMAKERPWLGVGSGQYTWQQIQRFHVEPWEYQPPHNIYLYLLVTIGAFGLIGLIIPVIIGGFTWNATIMASLTVIALTGMLDHYWLTIQQAQLLLVILLGMAFPITNRDVSRETWDVSRRA